MEIEFEPAVHTEETPEARIVIVDLPGFRREDLRVQVDFRGNGLIISGERGVKEMGEVTKAGGRLEKTQSEGHIFRKFIGVPENVNIDGITAKFKDRMLRVSLPFIQRKQTSPTEDVYGGEKLHDADPSEQSKPEERSSPVKQQGFMQEQPRPAPQNDESERVPEVIRPDDYTAKADAAVEERKPEPPEHGQDFVHREPPIPAISAEPGFDRDQSQFTPKSKGRKKDHKRRMRPLPNDGFHIPSSTTGSLFYNRGFLIASTVLVLCAAMYFSYILGSRKTDGKAC